MFKGKRIWMRIGGIAAVVLLIVIGANLYYDDSYKSTTVNKFTGKDVAPPAGDDERQMEKEDEQGLAEQFSEADVVSFLRTVNSELKGDMYNAQDLFIENGWPSYESFYHTSAYGEQDIFEITGIDYSFDDKIFVAVKESYDNDRGKQEYATNYTLVPDFYDDELRISAFTSKLTKQTEAEIPLGQGEIAAFLGNFRSQYMLALNEGNSYYINHYFEQNSPAYKELRDYIASIAGRGYRFEQMEFRVDSVSKQKVNHYTATAFEKFIFTDAQGEKLLYERTKNYLVRVLPGKKLSIENIDITNTKQEKITEPTVHLASHVEVMEFMRSYYPALEMAFNGSGFSYIQRYYEHNTPTYADTEKYISNANTKNMHMTNLDMQIESVVPAGDQHYLVTILVVDQYSYQDGSGDQKRVRAQYKVRVTNTGDLLISETPPVQILEKIEL